MFPPVLHIWGVFVPSHPSSHGKILVESHEGGGISLPHPPEIVRIVRLFSTMGVGVFGAPTPLVFCKVCNGFSPEVFQYPTPQFFWGEIPSGFSGGDGISVPLKTLNTGML